MKYSILKLFVSVLSVCMLFSCEDDGQDNPDMTGTYYVLPELAGETHELEEGESLPLNLWVCADTDNDTVGSHTLTVSLKVDPDCIEQYNSKHGTSYQLLPASAYEFVVNEVLLPRYGTKSSTAAVKLTGNGLANNREYLLPIGIDKVTGGAYHLSSFPYAVILVKAIPKSGGSGSKEDPYLIRKPDDMLKMATLVVDGETRYFRLENDIDLSGITTWIPINTDKGYGKAVDFDGNGKVISNFYCASSAYPSLFGVLNGKVYDLTFEYPVIEGDLNSKDASGVIGGYCGTGAIQGYMSNVHVVGGKVTSKGAVGGLAGILGNGTLDRCSFEGEILGAARYAGGLVGYQNDRVADAVCNITNCYTTGTLTGRDQQNGGIIGALNAGKTSKIGAKVINCYSTMSIVADKNAGGIVAMASKGNSDATADMGFQNYIQNCIAWNDKIEVTGTNSQKYGSGVVVGFTNIRNYLSGCYRRPGMPFACPVSGLAEGYSIVVVDQPDASPSAPLANGINGASDATDYSYLYPYHGKQAGADETVSSIAKRIGWDESIWNLSGNLPKLK